MGKPETGDAFRGLEAARAEKARENVESRREADKDLDVLAQMGVIASTTAMTLPDPILGSKFIRQIDPPMDFAIKPILPRAEVIEVNGGHGRLKSTLVLGWVMSIATGRDWGNFPVTKGKTAFISVEDRARIVRARCQAWIAGLPDRETQLAAMRDLDVNFSCLTRETAGGYAVTTTERGRVIQVEAVIKKLKEIAKDHILVVLETTARLHGGEEDNAGLIAFALAIESIATETGATIVIIRHQSKSDARAQTADSYSGRGGGAMADAARGVFVVTRPDVADPKEKDLRPVVLTHAKTTIGAPIPPTYWKPEVVNLPNGDTPVYLRLMSKSEVANGLEAKVLEEISKSFPEGIMRDDLIKSMPAAERGKVRGVLDELTKRGTVIAESVVTGKKGKPPRLYKLPEWNVGEIEVK